MQRDSVDEPKTVSIDAAKIVAKIEEQQLKRWWIAQQMGVDARTLRRWLNGQVKKMHLDNLTHLAEVLRCSKDELVVKSTADVFTNHNQLNVTADIIDNEGLVYDIFAEGKWGLIENILKAIIHFNMPRNGLAKIYINLSLLSWVQYNLEDSEAYAIKALDIGNKTQSSDIIYRAKVLLSLKKIFNSELAIAKELLEEVACKSLDTEVLSFCYINLGINLLFFGDYQQSEQILQTSFTFIDALKDSKSKSMMQNTAHAVLANLYFDAGRFTEARQSCLTSLQVAKNCGYKRGIGLALIRLAELTALEGQTAEGVKLFEEGMSLISPSEVLLMIYESGGSVYRLHGDFDRAEAAVRQGLSQSKSYTGEGTLYLQLAKIEYERKQPAKAQNYLNQAKKSFKSAGCMMRLLALESQCSEVHDPL